MPDILDSPQPSKPAPHSSSKSGSWMPKILIGVVLVFAILVVAYGLTSHNSSKKAATKVAQLHTAQVSITAKGLSPAALQIQPNTQITWTNNDTKVHQIAADPYPTNNSIPGFDSQIILTRGGTLSFTFGKAGTYTYHDEKNPMKTSYRGTITVK